MSAAVVRVMNPYRDTALMYRQSWWLGPLYVPYKEKNPPPTDWTGHRAGYPSKDLIEEWCNDGKKHNICIRLAGVDKEHEIIGIDVDHYRKGDKDKKGGDQLKELEARLGELPDTWISSARTDGISGIRFFRVPRGMAFRGQIDKDIECINKGYRFAVVWPSIHPDGGTYWWFGPGILPTRAGRDLWDGTLPDARTLPTLPEKWLDYVTQGRMRSAEADLIDMDSSVSDIYMWADDTFWGEDSDEPCDKMASKLKRHCKLVENEATSHDKLTNAHYNLIRLAAEGHVGWNSAVNQLEAHYEKITLERGKRGLTEVHGEIFRSRINALRKVKGQTDARLAIGANAVDPLCLKLGACGGADSGVRGVLRSGAGDDGLDDIPKGVQRPVDTYEMNDDGNAEHFVDQYSSASIGPSVRFADGYGWLIWRDNSDSPHWELDATGEGTMRRMWQRIKQRQLNYIDNVLQPDYEQQVAQWNFNGPMPANVKAAKAKLEKWKKFVELNGNNRNAENAIKAVRPISNVCVDVNELDRNPYLLGVANGVVELDGENIRLRKAIALDYVTLSTRVNYDERPSDLATKSWQEYLDTFLPDRDLQRATQIALGHTLIGGNPEKIMLILKGAPNTGKSTMVTAILTALGDYAEPVNHSIFQQHKLNPILADAIKKRVIVCSEFDEDDRLSASTIKSLTGGHDEIRAEKKGSNAKFSGIPQFVPILATNAVPDISGADKALQNRLYVIPFDIQPAKIRKEFATVIQRVCGTAILGWLIEGYTEYRRLGALPISQQIRDSTEEFASELDDVSFFCHEWLQRAESKAHALDPEWCVSRADMYSHFERFWTESRLPRFNMPSPHALTKKLTSLGFDGTGGKKTKNIGGDSNRWWFGVKKVVPKAQRTVVKMPKISEMRAKRNDDQPS